MTSSQDDSTVFTSNTQHPRTGATASVCRPWERGRPVRSVSEWTRPRYIWALVALVGFVLMSGWARMALTQNATLTLISAGDTTLKQGTPNANEGDNASLRIQQGGINRVLVRFDQQSLEQGIGNSSIRSAKLRLYIAANGNNWGSDGREVNVHRLTQAWTETGATWNCPNDTNTGNGSPDCSPSWEMGGSSLPPFATAPTRVILHQNNQTGWVEWDVADDVRKFLADQADNHGWIIRKDDEAASGQMDYASSENANRPQLLVELGEPGPSASSGIIAVSDADVRAGSPNQNQGNRMRLQAQSSGNNRVLVQFDRPSMLATVGSGTLQTAKLRLYVASNANNWGSSGRAVNVHRMTQAWTEQGTTWNCGNDLNPFNSQSDCSPNWNMSNSSQWPFVAAATGSMVQQNNQTGWVEWDVTSDVAQILANSVPNYGWLIRKDNEGQAGQVEYGSRESQYKPELRLTVQENNQAPQVSAGADQTITLPSIASLVGAASDDGLPSGSTLTYLWSQMSGPGTASFSTPASAATVVTFNLPGTYVLRLTVSDSQLNTNDEVTVVVNSPPMVNQAPQVSAGPDQSITLPAAASLNGSASDDGLPAGSTLALSWSKVGGAGAVNFANPTMAVTAATFGAPGDYILRLTASDTALSSADDVNVTVNAAPVNQAPQVSAGPDQTITLPATASLNGTASEDGLPAGSTLSVTWSKVSGVGTVTFAGPNSATTVASFSVAGIYVVRLTASDSALSSSDDVTVTVNPAGPSLPPDPVTVAPPLDRTVPTTMFAATEFLYAGADPIQTGVAPGTIKPLRVAVVRGKVKDRDLAALSGVTITVLNHAEFGQTLSRADGAFDMAMNGGGNLIVNYEKAGYLPAQRQVKVAWQDYAFAPDVVMIPVDTQVTTVTLNSGAPQVAQGSLVTDSSGSRRATVLFPAGTTANMVLPNGSTQPLSSLQLRATEYTIGPNGPKTMPAPLPPDSGYTYAVEYSADEALAAGARSVQFNQPVIHYNENFLGFPAGTVIPLGYYDRQKGAWVPGSNGQVIYILSIVDGQAVLDVDGTNTPATPEAYAARGITGVERQQLASLYAAGQSLWRVPVAHFSPIDCNLGVIPTNGTFPGQQDPQTGGNPQDDPICRGGSIIECQNQTLGESVGVVGTPVSLEYRSDLVSGRRIAYSLKVSLSGSTVPASLADIVLEIGVAGQHVELEFPAASNQSYTFQWDGKDAYGRTVNGKQKAQVRIGYRYNADYSQATAFARNDGIRISLSGGGGGGGFVARETVTLWQDQEAMLGTMDATGLGLGGWRVSQHHLYDPIARMLHEGNGARRGLQSVQQIITTVAGGGSNASWPGVPGGVPGRDAQIGNGPAAAAPDGGFYIHFDSRLNRLDSSGILTRIPNYAGSATKLAVDREGFVLVADSGTVRRVNPLDGSSVLVAGTGSVGFSGDNGLATSAQIDATGGVAVGSDGSLFIGGGHRIRKIDTGGLIATIAGNGSASYSGDGGSALAAGVPSPANLIVAADGSLYFTSFNPAGFGDNRIRRISPGGVISFVVSRGGNNVDAMAFGPDGSLYLSEFNVGFTIFGSIISSSLKRLTAQNTLLAITDTGVQDNGLGTDSRYRGDDGSPGVATVGRIAGMAFVPDGYLFLSDASNGTSRVRRLSPGAPDFRLTENAIPSEEGSEIYIFSDTGRHLRTVDALTGGTLLQFGYDANGKLATLTDGDNQVTTIQRDGSGNATAIVGPHGQTSPVAVGGDGYLASLTNPEGEAHAFTYYSGGLLATMHDPKQSQYSFQYDSQGLLTRDDDPAGGFKTLARTDLVAPFPGTATGGYHVTLGMPLSNATLYRVTQDAVGNRTWTNTASDGTTTISAFSIHGSDVTTAPDGTITNLIKGPDPRWGMQTPLAKSLSVRLPSSLTSTLTTTRTVTLSQAFNPLSLATQTDTVTINGRTYTSLFNNSTKTFTNTSPVGRQNTSVVDNLGRILQSQLASLYAVLFSYDSQGRLETIKQGSGTDERTTLLAYNSEGFLQNATDPLNRVTGFQYDDAGRVTQQTLPGNRVIGFNYDANGNLTSLTPPGKPQHAFDYTEVDLMKEYDPPTAANVGTRLTTYSYDTERKPTLITRPDGQTIDFDYDTAGRLSVLNLPSRQLVYGYNATTGNLTSITDSTGSSLAYTYDGSLPKSSTWSGPVSGSVAWNYDNNFRVTSRSINGTNAINFGYDNDSLLTQTGALTLSRNPQNGLLTGTTLGNVSDSWAYDDFAEPTNYTASISGTPVYSTTFTRDKLSRITSKIETIQGVTDNYSYGYDVAGRLETVTKNGNLVSQYTYDTNGNRLSALRTTNPEPLTTYTYDAQDRLLSTQYSALSTQYSYNPNGELQSKTNGSQTTSYEYDVVGNLRHVTLPDGTQIDYVIDGQNRRVGKKVNAVLVQGWLYGNQLNPIAELDGTGSVVSVFVYGSRSNAPDYMVKSGITYRIVSDHLGSPRLIINTSDGSITQRLDYDEFGNITQDTNPAFQPFGFAGGLHESQTRLTRFGARDYDSETGRWTAKDPILFAGGDANLYGYVLQDPANWIDPIGQGRFGARPIDVPGTPSGFGSRAPLDPLNLMNVAPYHEQYFFDDGTNRGHFPTGIHEDRTRLKDSYRKFGPEHDDTLMREAMKNVEKDLGKYCFLGNNCQDYADRLRKEYERLQNERSNPKHCPIRPSRPVIGPFPFSVPRF